MFVVLVNPKIPQNTGSIARTCAGTDTELILCGKLGFSLEDRYLKRAGLDYWDSVKLSVYESFDSIVERFRKEDLFFFSRYGKNLYTDARYTAGSVLIFGSEDFGIPFEILSKFEDQTYYIPHNTNIRCLNLSNSVNIVLYEALRQNNFFNLKAE